MNQDTPLRISIIIPTRDRCRYLPEAVRTALAIDDPDIEVIVSNNSSLDDTDQVMAGFSDPRLRLVNPGARVSMRQNFEFALSQSTGDYVIFIGDDDGIIPGQFRSLRRILETERPDGVIWSFLTYNWPVEANTGKAGGLRLSYRKLFGNVQELDSVAMRKRLENGNFLDFYPQPAIYHGCMSRQRLMRLANDQGEVFLSHSPDLHISFRATQAGEGRYVFVQHPFTINGFSPASTGGGWQRTAENKAGEGVTSAQKFTAEVSVDTIREVIPLTPSMALVFLSVVETVRRDFPDPPLVLNYEGWYQRVLENCARMTPENRNKVEAALAAHTAQTGSQAALEAARRNLRPMRARLRAALAKTDRLLKSVRVDAGDPQGSGRNTILTAALLADRLLGAGYDPYSGSRPSWSQIKARARPFLRGR